MGLTLYGIWTWTAEGRYDKSPNVLFIRIIKRFQLAAAGCSITLSHRDRSRPFINYFRCRTTTNRVKLLNGMVAAQFQTSIHHCSTWLALSCIFTKYFIVRILLNYAIFQKLFGYCEHWMFVKFAFGSFHRAVLLTSWAGPMKMLRQINIWTIWNEIGVRCEIFSFKFFTLNVFHLYMNLLEQNQMTLLRT